MSGRAVLVLVGLAALVLFALLIIAQMGSHGHIDELLDVTVRIETATGEPVEGAVVATVRYRAMLSWEDFGGYLERALNMLADRRNNTRRPGPVCATTTTAAPETTIRSSAWFTRHWFGSALTRENVHLPELLLIEHPQHGRILVPIDPDTPLEEGEQPKTWRMDLGTIRIPQ